MQFIKNNQQFNINLKYDEIYKFYTIEVVNNNVVIGKASFKLNYSDRKVWLYKIETAKEYQHKGVGNAMLNIMEYIACKNGVNSVEGKFYPDNEFAKPFYEKNGYDIYKDEYETYLGKVLNSAEIIKKIEPCIKNFNIESEMSR